MTDFQKKLESLRSKFQAKIKPESTPEEIEEINGYVNEINSLGDDYNNVVSENAKFKDTIVNMVTSQGNDKTPADATSGRKTMSIEEVVAEIQKGGN